MSVSKPNIEDKGSYIKLTWQTEKLAITASRLHEHKDGHVTAEILIERTDTTASHLHQAQFNLSSSQSRASLAKVLSSRYSSFAWLDILEQLCAYVLRSLRARDEEPVEELHSDMDDVRPPEYMLYPLLPAHAPTTIYGDGGSGKSYLALAIAITLSLAWNDNKLGWRVRPEAVNTLYLDYEADKNTMRWRLKKLTRGLNLPLAFVNYRRCSRRFVDDIDNIRKAVIGCNAGLVIIDSVGGACAGDMNSAEIATEFFIALRSLDVTSLLLNHQSKNELGLKTSYGSVYFRNYSRSEWKIKKTQGVAEDTIEICLSQTKVNDDKLHAPLGYRLHFNPTTVSMERCEVTQDTSIPMQRISLTKQIIDLLEYNSGKRMTVDDIAAALGADGNTVKARLNDGKEYFKHYENGWGLLQ